MVIETRARLDSVANHTLNKQLKCAVHVGKAINPVAEHLPVCLFCTRQAARLLLDSGLPQFLTIESKNSTTVALI